MLYLVFAVAYGLMRAPVVVLTLLVYSAQNFSDGPTTSSRRWLLLATFLGLAMTLPPTVWAELLPRACVIYFASITDILQWVNLLSLGAYFVFLRAEYRRNMEVRACGQCACVRARALLVQRRVLF